MSAHQDIVESGVAGVHTEQDTQITHDVGVIARSGEIVVQEIPSDERMYQGAPPNNLTTVFQRPTLINTLTLATGGGSSALLDSFDPWLAWVANSFVAGKLEGFYAVKGSLTIDIVTNITPACSGLLMVAFLPNGYQANTTDVLYDNVDYAQNTAQCNHVMIDLSRSSNASITLPWIAPYDFQPTADCAEMWKVLVYQLSPLNSALNATPTGVLNFYCRGASDFDVLIPVQQSKTKSRSGGSYTAKAVKAIGEAQESKVVSSTANTVSKYAAMAGAMVPAIAPLAEPIAAGAAAFAGIASMLGFTRESAPDKPTPVVPRPLTVTNCVDGQDSSELAAMYNSNAISNDPTIGGGMSSHDPMAFEHMFSRWTIVANVPWSTTDNAQDILLTLPVTPMYSDTSFDEFLFSPAGFIGSFFEQWRGDMEYRVIIPVSQMHRGNLQIFWTKEPTNISVDITNVLFNDILDVSATSTRDYTVGYASHQPALKTTWYNRTYPTIKPYGDSVNGQLGFRVILPLSVPKGEDTVRVIVLARAKSNMVFGVPRKVIGLEGRDSYDLMEATVQMHSSSGVLGDEVVEVDSYTLVPESGDYPVAELLWGEVFTSARPLVQKFARFYGPSADPGEISNTRTLTIAHHPKPQKQNVSTAYWRPDLGTSFTGWNMMSAIPVLFTGVASSTRYKIFNPHNFNPVLITVGHEPNFDNVKRGVSTESPVWATTNTGAVEITVPYYGGKKYELGRVLPDVSSNFSIERFDTIQIFPPVDNEIVTTGMVIYRSFGPDFRVNMFRRVPRIEVRSTPHDYSTEQWATQFTPT